EPALATSGGVAAGGEEGALLVVLLALVGVGQHGVRLRDLLEALLGGLVAWVGVGVVGARELAVRLFDLVGGSVLGHAEDLIEVLARPVGGTHARTSLLIVVFVSSPAARSVRRPSSRRRRRRLRSGRRVPARQRRHAPVGRPARRSG